MTELPLSVNDYEKSVALVNLLTRIKDDIIALPSVTDAVFRPIINGYEVTFKVKGNSVKLEIKVSKYIFARSRFTIRASDSMGLIKSFKTDNADEACNEIKSILTQ